MNQARPLAAVAGYARHGKPRIYDQPYSIDCCILASLGVFQRLHNIGFILITFTKQRFFYYCTRVSKISLSVDTFY